MTKAALHGLAGGYVPDSDDWTMDQDWESYSAEDHAVWNTLFQRQTRLLPDYACREFVEGMKALPMGPDQIPDFRRVNDILEPKTGWQIVAVPGLVPDDIFFGHLAARRFPSGQFIRRADQLDYLQEPDVFHDVFGHVPMLMNPAMADVICAYGKGGLRAMALGVLPLLARVYWYTVEFGLIREAGRLRLFGAGIASSFTESRFCLDDPSPNRIGFDLERVMRTHYRIDDFQETYFALNELDQLMALAETDFAPIYARIQNLSPYEPGDVLGTDTVIHKGTGTYHQSQSLA